MIQGIFLLFIAAISVRVTFALFIFIRLSLSKSKPKYNAPNVPVSIITCYHNEIKNVRSSISMLSSQVNIAKEIILVDDISTDGTTQIIDNQSAPNIIKVLNKEPHHGKKLALTKGIQAANHDWLLLTDADCTMSTSWASTMASYTGDSRIVLGFAPLNRSEYWIAKFARYETWYTAVQYLSYALSGLPYMGVGRNLMYHRSIFNKSGGFNAHMHIASGDDDLLVNVAANADNTSICIDPQSFVYSDAKETFSSFIKQKSRHISSAHQYRWINKVLLGLSSAVHIMMYLLALILITMGNYIALYAILSFWLLMLIINFPICKKLDSMDLWLWYPIYDIMMAIYYVIMIPITFAKNKNTWS